MIFVDTHSHLYSEEFDQDRDEVIERAQEAGVKAILLPDVDSSSRQAMLSMCERYSCCRPMVGLHPTSINDNPEWRAELDRVEDLLREDSSRYCAVGEFGMDLYWSREFESEQREAFVRQVELALEYDLPVDIHSRDAWDVTIELLTPFKGRGLRGVIHAFSGEVEHYRALCEIGDLLFGIGGVVTFKRSKLAPVVAEMSLEHIVFETDAPYLTPAPHRGKRNESSYIPHIAAVVADLHAEPLERVAQITTRNAERMFGLKI